MPEKLKHYKITLLCKFKPANIGDAIAEQSTKKRIRFSQSDESSTKVISAFTPTNKTVVSICTLAEPLVADNTPVSKKIGRKSNNLKNSTRNTKKSNVYCLHYNNFLIILTLKYQTK